MRHGHWGALPVGPRGKSGRKGVVAGDCVEGGWEQLGSGRVHRVTLFIVRLPARNEATHGGSDSGLSVAEANIATGGELSTSFMPGCKFQ